MVDKEEESVKHIADIVGEWGRWQRHFFFYCFLLSTASAVNNMGYAFHSYNVDFWCSDVPIDYPVFKKFFDIFVKKFCSSTKNKVFF
jgi:hypothetical protein